MGPANTLADPRDPPPARERLHSASMSTFRFPRAPRAALTLSVSALALSLLVACGGDTPPPKTQVAADTAPVPRPLTPSDSACPRDGRWKACHLEDRINKAGMPISVIDTLRLPGVAEPGVRYKIGKTAKMVVFFFGDSAAGVAATAALDPQRLTPKGDTIGTWPTRPAEVVRSANLIAVLFEVNPTQAERVRLAITAGAPQPYSAPPPQLPEMQAR